MPQYKTIIYYGRQKRHIYITNSWLHHWVNILFVLLHIFEHKPITGNL